MVLFSEIESSGRVWHKPPLAFQGNKKNQLKRFRGVLQNLNITPETVLVDVFGGAAGDIFQQRKQRCARVF